MFNIYISLINDHCRAQKEGIKLIGAAQNNNPDQHEANISKGKGKKEVRKNGKGKEGRGNREIVQRVRKRDKRREKKEAKIQERENPK